MPTYEYECEKCKDHFEKFQNMTDAPLEICPKCGGRVERLIGAGAGFIFKGTGFYATDYKKSSNKKDDTSCPAANKSGECKTCPKNPAPSSDK